MNYGVRSELMEVRHLEVRKPESPKARVQSAEDRGVDEEKM